MPRALLLTVGTGDRSRPEESLFAPLRKSIASGTWQRIVLLPSAVTQSLAAALAAAVREQAGDATIEVAKLPSEGMENDVDACFGHYDRVIGDLRQSGIGPTDIIVDFTRGTKAMSAALVLAAARHDIAGMRYIDGDRDGRGTVKAGTERINSVSPVIATGRRRLDAARQFLVTGNFAAALEIVPDSDAPIATSWPQHLRDAVTAVRPIAEFYGAWDRLDHRSAASMTLGQPGEWADLAPSPAMVEWVGRLAAPLPGGPAEIADRLRLLAVDLLANGERRIRDRQFEDAILRAYRVLELIGQARLFAHGLDSARLPADDPHVLSLQHRLERKRSVGFGRNADGTLNAGRDLVARLLKQMGDGLAERLLRFDEQFPVLKATARNTSVLIHGFEATGPTEAQPLNDLYRGLERLLIEDGGQPARNGLSVARSLDLGRPR